MFDLEKIEEDWKNSSFNLTEDEIMKIYQSEGITLNNYLEEEKRFNNSFISPDYVSIGLEYFKYVYNGNKALIEKIYEDFNTFYSKIKPIEYKSSELKFLSKLNLLLHKDKDVAFQEILNKLNISYVLKSIEDENNSKINNDFLGYIEDDDFLFDEGFPFISDTPVASIKKREDNFEYKHDELTFDEINEYERRKKEYENWYLDNYNKEAKLTKRHLSTEKQKIVVAGCMNYVFCYTKEYYNYLNGQVEIEKIYYLLLESLINAVKYCLHCEKSVFRLYISACFKRSITSYIAKLKHVNYRDIYPLVKHMEPIDIQVENLEDVYKPSTIFYQMRNNPYDENYDENINNEEFMRMYMGILDQLGDLEKQVMLLSYDKNGYSGLTYREISDYLGISEKQVENIKRKCLRNLRKNEDLKGYLK